MKKNYINNMQLEFVADNNKEYKINIIRNSSMNVKELAIEQLLRLYYLAL